MPEPSLDKLEDIRNKADRIQAFLEWLAETLGSKNWVRILALALAVFLVVFNPLSFSHIAKAVGIEPLPPDYPSYFWGIAAALFVAALVFAIRARSQKGPPGFDPAERSAIKGLRPFTFEDEEIFARLQREDKLRECLNAITDPDFRLGILYGESGCGKTSFLQAGLWSMMPKYSASHQCIYVKFTDRDPLETIREAAIKQTGTSREATGETGLLALLEGLAAAQNKTLALVFDQLEQFFVHHPRREQRLPFIQFLSGWYNHRPGLSLKILFCLRSDFTDRMFELQKALGYSLGPQDTFQLEKFSAEQTTEIFRVLAENAGLSFDRNFVAEMAQQELASREDGLISPVDIQILAWMIHGQKTGGQGGFNKTVYQQLGGIEGLLENYLSRALASLATPSQRTNALKVLLILTDLEGGGSRRNFKRRTDSGESGRNGKTGRPEGKPGLAFRRAGAAGYSRRGGRRRRLRAGPRAPDPRPAQTGRQGTGTLSRGARQPAFGTQGK